MSDTSDAEELRKLIEQHYSKSDAPLLLSWLGARLRAAGIEVSGGLKEFILGNLAPAYEVLTPNRGPRAPAVVPAKRAEQLQLTSTDASPQLQDISPPVLFAFCKRIAEDASVFLSLGKPHRYFVVPAGNPPPEGSVPVEKEYRHPGTFLGKFSELPPDTSTRVFSSISAWAKHHDVALEDLRSSKQRRRQTSPKPDRTESALDRLLAAQSPDVRRAMMIPGDIAELLSKKR